jgi:hypothetical protein
MTMLMMSVMNSPAKASETDGITAPGNVTVEMCDGNSFVN